MAILNPINPYEKWDQARDIIEKNKVNILNLYGLLDDVVTDDDLKALVSLVGDYSTDDPTGLLDEKLSVIANVGVVASNLRASLLRISAAESAINTLASRVSIIEKDGIGNWIGTYVSSGNDDSSTLPNPAQEQDRAMTEYATGDSLKYQEWKYLNSVWGKIGTELDSHIHSQGGGISLVDVAQQQDPKIDRVLGAFIPALDITTEAELFNKVELHKNYELKDPSDGHNIGKFSVYSKTSGLVVLFGFANDDKAGRPIMITAMINVQTMFKMILVNLESGDPTEDNHVVNKRWFLANQIIRDLSHLTTEDGIYTSNAIYAFIAVGGISGKGFFFRTSHNSVSATYKGYKFASGEPTFVTIIVHKGNTDNITSTAIIPTRNDSIVYKKYVDDEIAKIPAGGGSIPAPIKYTSGKLDDDAHGVREALRRGDTVIAVEVGNSGNGESFYPIYILEGQLRPYYGPNTDISNDELADSYYILVGQLYK